MALGHAWHREINLAADSSQLAMLLGSVVRTLPLQFYSTIEGWIDSSHHQHLEIIETLRKHDARKTRTLMQRHISEGGDRLIETLRKRGLWNDIDEDRSGPAARGRPPASERGLVIPI